MKKVFALLFVCFVLSFAQSCKVFQKKEFYFEVGKVFTESNIKKIFNLETFSFENVKNIDVQKSFLTIRIVKILGAKLASKITGNGRCDFSNERVTTFIVWETKEGVTTIRYFRKAI